MMASGEAVPLTALEGVSPNQAELLAEKGIEDVEALAAVSVDNLVDYLDVSLDEAERIIGSAKVIVEARNLEVEPGDQGEAASEEPEVTQAQADEAAEEAIDVAEAEGPAAEVAEAEVAEAEVGTASASDGGSAEASIDETANEEEVEAAATDEDEVAAENVDEVASEEENKPE
jgi:hypothetical protein